MDTNSPASTNGDSVFTLGQTGPLVTMEIPSHVKLPSLIGKERYYDPVNIEVNIDTRTLTHSSATAAYAVYKADSTIQGFRPVSFDIWLVTAQALISHEIDRLKDLQASTNFVDAKEMS